MVSHKRIRGNGRRLKYRKFHSKHSFVRVAEHWNVSPAAVLEPPLVVVLKTQLDTVLTNSLDDLDLTRKAGPNYPNSSITTTL